MSPGEGKRDAKNVAVPHAENRFSILPSPLPPGQAESASTSVSAVVFPARETATNSSHVPSFLRFRFNPSVVVLFFASKVANRLRTNSPEAVILKLCA